LDTNSSHTHKTIMIADDELFFRTLLRNILEEEGFTVVAEAVDGIEAVEKYSLHHPVITIMDIYMPGKNGIDAMKEILLLDKNAKVLICSGSGYDDDVEFAIKVGAKEAILKPFIRKEVTDIIKKVMDEQ
jgi:two-component system, chemotaxis family, chemotaxis protein CheY